MGNRMGEAHGRAIRGPAESPELASSVERLYLKPVRLRGNDREGEESKGELSNLAHR